MKKTFKISGMHCSSCALRVEWELEDIGVKAQCNYPRGELTVEYDPQKISLADIKKAVGSAGYLAS